MLPVKNLNSKVAMSADITCAICEEVYNLEERKPLLLPCSHTFCRTCLLQLQSTNSELCPHCRSSWAGQAVDSLPVIRQLAESSDKKPKTKKHITGNQNICDLHNDDLNAWCRTCNVATCIQCLKDGHKSCDWISIKRKTTELMSLLDETVTYTRTKLIENFTQTTTESNSMLTEVRENIKKMQSCEKLLRSFQVKLSVRQDIAMNQLENYETILVDSSVNELTTAVSNTLALLDDTITVPTILMMVVTGCEEILQDIDTEDEWNEEGPIYASIASTTSDRVRPIARYTH